jgi:hypothetical protein
MHSQLPPSWADSPYKDRETDPQISQSRVSSVGHNSGHTLQQEVAPDFRDTTRFPPSPDFAKMSSTQKKYSNLMPLEGATRPQPRKDRLPSSTTNHAMREFRSDSFIHRSRPPTLPSAPTDEFRQEINQMFSSFRDDVASMLNSHQSNGQVEGHYMPGALPPGTSPPNTSNERRPEPYP